MDCFMYSFWSGFTNVFNLYGTFPYENFVYATTQDDYENIKGDWFNVGQDIKKSIKQFSQ